MDTLVFINNGVYFVSEIQDGIITKANKWDYTDEIQISDNIQANEFQVNELGYGLNSAPFYYGYDQLFFGDLVDPGVKHSGTDYYFLYASKVSQCGNPVCVLLKVRDNYQSLCYQRYLQLDKLEPGSLTQREVYTHFKRFEKILIRSQDDLYSFEEIKASIQNTPYTYATQLDLSKLISRIGKIEVRV